jgi:hypothetical protein
LPPDTQHLCVDCKSSIHAEARLCPVCKTYQSKAKRFFQYIATVIGVVTAIAAVIVYIISSVPAIRRQDRIEIVDFYSNTGVAVANSGDGEVYISRVSVALLDIPAGVTVPVVGQSFDVGIVLPSGSVTQHKFSGRPKFDYFPPSNEETWAEMQRQASIGADSCFIFVYASDNSPMARQFESANTRIVAAKGTVFYYFPQRGRWLTRDFPAHATVAKIRNEKCDAQFRLPVIPKTSR